MVQVLALQVDLCSAQNVRPVPGVIDRTWPTDVMLEFIIDFGDELRIALGSRIRLFQFIQRSDQGFSDEDAAVRAKMATGVR